MPIDFSDILGALIDGLSSVGDLSPPYRGTSTDYTPPLVDGKRVVRFAPGLKVAAWTGFVVATAISAVATRGQPPTVWLVATLGTATLAGWLAMEVTRRRLRFDATGVYDRRFLRGERRHDWNDLSDATAFELGGGRLRFSTGAVVRVSSHLNGAWLLVEAARRVLKKYDIEVQPAKRARRRSRKL
jgi:hypothetical protein